LASFVPQSDDAADAGCGAVDGADRAKKLDWKMRTGHGWPSA